jgi:hypothetical protein
MKLSSLQNIKIAGGLKTIRSTLSLLGKWWQPKSSPPKVFKKK